MRRLLVALAEQAGKLLYLSNDFTNEHAGHLAHELAATSLEWAGQAVVELYRCEVAEDGTPTFIQLD